MQTPTVLILIDLQQAIDDPSWGERNNPDAEQIAVRLLTHWREKGWPVIHVKHDSTEPQSTYRPGQPGNHFKPEFLPLAGETVIAKRTNSAFIGTPLELLLRANHQETLAICGVITNNSVEATVRNGANLGFTIYLAEDACFTFGRNDWQGRKRTADEVHALSLANLHGEYCTVLTADELIQTVEQV